MKKRTGLKRAGLILCTVISLFIMVGSSVWEGAAGVAAGGDLPGTGLYIATNSFPLNTVVYVTNLENGQTARVVTSAPLEAAPGLLALLSRDAAEAIGLPNRTLGRIRMSQPPDSVAFSRFGHRRPVAGDPDFDPAAFAALHYLFAEAANTDDIIIDLPITDEAQVTLIPLVPFEAQEEIAEIVQENEIPQAAAWAEEAPLPLEVAAVGYVPVEEIAEQYAVEQDVQEVLAGEENEQFHQNAIALMRGFFPEHEVVEDMFAEEPEIEEQIAEQIIEQVIEPQEIAEAAAEPVFPASDYILTFIPAEARPPPAEAAITPDPAYIIPGIEPAQAVAAWDYQPDFIDPAMIIDPIGEPPLALQPVVAPVVPEYDPEPEAVLVAEPVQVEAPEEVEAAQHVEPVHIAEPLQHVEPVYIVEPLQIEQVQDAVAVIPPQGPLFPVPLINNLQTGKHYLQLAAYSNAEAVHYELSRLDRIDSGLARELVVKRYMNHPDHGIVYQILIGPLSLGESGALLHRFRNTTHRDAFIRTGS